MSQAAPAPKLTTLPLELKQAIYSHLLAPNAIKYSTNRTRTICTRQISLAFDTALFRTCKAVSEDALHFFYTQNRFILIETELKEIREFIHDTHGYLPIVCLDSGDVIQHHAVRMCIGEDVAVRQEGLEGKKFLLPGKHFGQFLQFLNEELHYGGKDGRVVINIEFRNASGIFEGMKGGASQLLQNVWDRCGGPTLSDSDSYMNDPIRDMRLEIHGDVLLEEAAIIRSAMERKWPTLDTITTQSSMAIERGNSFRREKRYLAAAFEYQLAFLIHKRTTTGLSSDDRDLKEDVHMTIIYRHLNNSYFNSELGLHIAARHSARRSRSHYIKEVATLDYASRTDLQWHATATDGRDLRHALRVSTSALEKFSYSGFVLRTMEEVIDLRHQLRALEKDKAAKAVTSESANQG